MRFWTVRPTWMIASVELGEVTEVTLPVEVPPVLVAADALPVVDVACPSIPTTTPYYLLPLVPFPSSHTLA
jgi:hypothetical protein